MTRFGECQVYDPKIRGNRLAEIFLTIFGTVDTGSGDFHFMRIVKKLAKIDFNHVLDAGCGKGKFSFWLAQEYPNVKIDACDLSEESIDLCREVQSHLKIRNIHFFVQDLRTYRSEGTYDFIFSTHVLEHILENRLVISNLVSSLKKGGYIYIQIPNAVIKRLSSFGKRFVKSHVEWGKKEHVGQTLTLNLLCSELQRSSCKILIAKHTEGFFGELRFELQEMALGYLHSEVLFAILYPLLKILGYIDSLVDYSGGNGILVLARKIPISSLSSASADFDGDKLKRAHA
jgi:SAM-dependent methyltransferase